MQACKGEVPIVKGDKFNKNQYLKNDIEKEFMKDLPYSIVIGN